MNVFAIIFLLIFGLIEFGTYIAIRRRLLSVRTAALLCLGGSVTALIAFGLAQESPIEQVIIMGGVAGLVFTGIVVLMAVFFLANQPPAELQAALREDKPKR